MKVIGTASIVVFFFALQATAQTEKTSYPSMASRSQYLMSRDAEISLAQSAAPKSISDDAEILILTKNGYQTAVRGTNGFVCMVARSWSADYESPDFWDPKLRAPICYNSVAAKSQVAATIKRTEVALGGGSKAQIFNSIKTAIDSGELPTAEASHVLHVRARSQILGCRAARLTDSRLPSPRGALDCIYHSR